MEHRRITLFAMSICLSTALVSQGAMPTSKLKIRDPMALHTGSFHDVGYWNGQIVALHSDLGGILAWRPDEAGYYRVPTPRDSLQGGRYAKLLYADDELIAVDLRRSYLLIFDRKTQKPGPRKIPIPHDASEVCALGGKMYAYYVPVAGGELDIIDSTGRQIRTIPLPHRRLPAGTLAFYASLMHPTVACSPNPALIVVMWEDSRRMIAFDTNGRERWEADRREFRPLQVRFLGASFTKTPPTGGNDETVGIVALHGGTMLVQTVRMTDDVSRGGEPLEYSTTRLDLMTGRMTRFAERRKIVGTFANVLVVQDTAPDGGLLKIPLATGTQ